MMKKSSESKQVRNLSSVQKDVDGELWVAVEVDGGTSLVLVEVDVTFSTGVALLPVGVDENFDTGATCVEVDA